ncbi:hypothetical protein [Paraflavitalea speifideaquila]|uniref:hypothetical protein n=1 Tax=Paraflavitalea speifideaquila TaxID=3076558 RepID=UPI0028E6B15B|nr:hypothetical protein [Paraflavitalea speifideiaquila]
MNSRIYLLASALSAGLSSMAQTSESLDTSYANGYYNEQVKFFSNLHPPKNCVVFLGNSITEVGRWSELLPADKAINRGISGDNSWGGQPR